MKINAIVYVILGIIAVIGAAFCAYLLFMLGDAINLISSADAASLPGTDIAGLQENVRMLGTIITVGWIWVISVLACGALTIKSGVDALKRKK